MAKPKKYNCRWNVFKCIVISWTIQIQTLIQYIEAFDKIKYILEMYLWLTKLTLKVLPGSIWQNKSSTSMFVLIKMSHDIKNDISYFTSNDCRVSVDAITADALLVEWELGTGLKEREKSSKRIEFLGIDEAQKVSGTLWADECICARARVAGLTVCSFHLPSPQAPNAMLHKYPGTLKCHGCEWAHIYHNIYICFVLTITVNSYSQAFEV